MKMIVLFLGLTLVFGCQATSSSDSATTFTNPPSKISSDKKLVSNAQAVFASGCFWCVEAVFESVEGVVEAESGYAGGREKNPTYQQVSAGRTGHAEAVRVYYDSTVVCYETLLLVFFDSHDASTLNRQGPDRGTQYRSGIYFDSNYEKNLAEKEVAKRRKLGQKITTEIAPLTTFWMAEAYHQNYEKRNPNNPYVRSVSIPRLKAFQNKHPELLKNKH